MGQLVEVKDGWVFCDSKMVAEKFDVIHPNVTRMCERILEKANSSQLLNLNSWPRIEKREFEYKGRPFKFYVMNKAAFMMVAMRFTTDKAFEWQLKFVQAFESLENRIALEESNKKNAIWVAQREQGKLIRLVTTDTIKDFVDYATEQGSQNAKFYYKHITEACYRCLQLVQAKRPKLRDTLDLFQINQLMVAEVVADRSIRKHMAEREHYKAIFTLVKQDLEKFAEGLMLNVPIKKKEIT
jgi:Rha family phage regulatory protein